MLCSECGKENRDRNKFCIYCGNRLNNLPEAVFSVVTVRALPSNVWQPKVAQQLMISLFSIYEPINFFIHAKNGSISWYIETFSELVPIFRKVFYSFYQNIYLTSEPKTSAYLDYRLYHYRTQKPFLYSLKVAEDFGNLDPLPTLISSMTGLKNGEEIVYQLSAREPANKKEQLKLGQKIVKEIEGEIRGAEFRTVEDQLNLSVLKSAQRKLSETLKEVTLSLKIKANSYDRAQEIVRQLDPGFAVFSQEASNHLIGAQEGTFTLLLSPLEMAALWHLPTEKMTEIEGIIWGRKEVPLTVDTPYGIILGHNTYQGETREVKLDYPDRVGHVNLIGKSGVGKSTLLHNMVHQDIANGKGVGVIDPHGDLVKDILACSIPPEREPDVIIFDVSDTDYPVGLNLLSKPPWIKPEVVASEALAIIRKLFAEQWSKTQMEDALYAALIALVSFPNSTIMDIPRLFFDPEFRYQVLSKVSEPVALEFWNIEFEAMTTAKQQQIAKPINNRVRTFYRNPVMRRIICQTDSLNFRQIMDGKKIFLANLGGLAEVEAETLGSILISKFQTAAMSRGNIPKERRILFYLTVDEVQNFTTTTLDKVFSEARKYGLSLTVANQFLGQLSGPVLKAVLGNVGATVIMQTNPDDARVVSPFLGGRFDKEDLVTLDKYTAAVTMQLRGQTLPAFSLMALPAPEDCDNADEVINRLRDQSRKDYGQPKDEIDAAIANRFQSDEPPPPDEDEEQWSEEDDDDLYDDQPPEPIIEPND